MKQRVVITEAFWADAERRPRRMQTLTWIIKSLPLLLLLSVAPDRQDIREPRFLRFFYRLAFPVLVIISLLQPSVRIWTLLLLVAVAASTSFRRTNLLGDVQIAATRDEEISEIVNEINSAIDAAFSIAERVVVVGHSQGGYLSHRALELRAVTRGTKERIELIGIGSGLKPISLLKAFGDCRSVAMATSFLCSMLLMLFFVTPFLLGFIQGWNGLLDWMVRINETLIEHVAAASLQSSAWHFTAWSHPMALVPDVWQIAALIGSVALFFLMRRRIRAQVLQLHQDLSCPGNVSRWTEITSSADTVGRLAWPHLSRANVWNCPSLGQPLVDHISYYRRSSPVAWCLGATLFPSLIGDTVPVLRHWANYLDVRIRQARTLSMILGMILLAAYALDRLNPGARGINALLDQGKNPGGLFAGLLAITLMAPALGMIDRHRLSAALDMRPMPSPPELKQTPMWLRLFGLCVWVPFAASVAATAHDLVRYPNMVSTESRLLPVAPEVTGFLICLLAASLAAGYRFSTATWSIVVLVVFWSTYLPGRGADFAAFVDGFVIITAIFFSVVYHFVARPIAVSSAEWPSFERGRVAGLRRSRMMPGS
ncbi:hypothetical protein [Streptomyces gardneri]|uniref:hypothetical protein n=1 Tax=Streptomyces gardneri TaxID=66892 RepID=UPI0035D929E5